MKKKVSFLFMAFIQIYLFIICLFMPSCTPDPPEPTPPPEQPNTIYFVIEGVEVSNGVVTSLGYNTVKFQGNFKKLQASTFKIIDYGYVVSSTSNEPTINNNEGISYLGERTGVGTFESEISGLTENKTYHARVYLKREFISTGVIEYGYHPIAISFNTKMITPPIILNEETKNISSTAFQVNALINDPNLLNIQEYGHIWSTSNPNLDINNNEGKTSFGSLQSVFTHSYSSNISNLEPNTTYFVKSYAKNQFGLIGYSQSLIIKTLEVPMPNLIISNFQNLTGDLSPNEIAIVKIEIKNIGNVAATQTKLNLDQNGVQYVTPNPLSYGTIPSGESIQQIIKFSKNNITSVSEVSFKGEITCNEGSFLLSNVFSTQTLPSISVSNNLVQYFRFNYSPADEMNYTLAGSAEDTITYYSPNRVDDVGASLKNGYITNITPNSLQTGINSTTEMTINFWAVGGGTHSFYIDSQDSDNPAADNTFEFNSSSGWYQANYLNKFSMYTCNTFTHNSAGQFANDGQWHMVTIILENNSNGRILIDAGNIYTIDIGKEISPCNFNDRISIGAFNNTSIDNLRIYDRKLSQSEIQTLLQEKQ